MASTFASSSNGVDRRVCYCGGVPRVLTSHSHKNPNRTFWRCPNWRDNPNAHYFKWVDEDANEASQGEIPSEHVEAAHQIPPRNADAAEFGVEYWKMKSKKLQRKLRDEREKSRKLIYIVILTCIVAFGSNIVCLMKCH
ncbi:hypothetical protein RIF29_39527 [Crotalaria pallida]|uniref:GRF-type domain-containing protein n=1 Tax=Crotalaria pallida TaxID=3830 RepID=A0AAN9E275_CROPI